MMNSLRKKCKKGDIVTVYGTFTENEYKGKVYINFIVKDYKCSVRGI